MDLQCAYTGNGNIAAPRDVVDAWICNVQTRKTESTLHRGMSVVDRILHTREMETTLHRGRCALLCGSVPAHEEKTLHGAASQATKAFAELRRGQCIIKLIAAALGSVILLLSKKPRGKHSKDTMIATLRGFAELRELTPLQRARVPTRGRRLQRLERQWKGQSTASLLARRRVLGCQVVSEDGSGDQHGCCCDWGIMFRGFGLGV